MEESTTLRHAVPLLLQGALHEHGRGREDQEEDQHGKHAGDHKVHGLRFQFFLQGNLPNLGGCGNKGQLLRAHLREFQAQVLQERAECLAQGIHALGVAVVVE